jgi:hypothetical protein
MSNFFKSSILAVLLTLSINSQELCPITFKFYDVGVPQWLDKQTILERLKSKASKKNHDPLIEKLIAYTNRQDCSKALKERVSFDLEQAIEEKSFINQKSFNCRSSANKLNSIRALRGGGKVVIIRGSHRILFAHVGENSFCVNSRDYDGINLNETQLAYLYDRLFGDYIIKKLEEQGY